MKRRSLVISNTCWSVVSAAFAIIRQADDGMSALRVTNGIDWLTDRWDDIKNSSHTRYRALGPELIPVYRQSARRWLSVSNPAVGCHYFPPGLQLPPQPQSITASWPVPSYTAWWQSRIGESNLPKVVTQLCPSKIWTHDPLIASNSNSSSVVDANALYSLRHSATSETTFSLLKIRKML